MAKAGFCVGPQTEIGHLAHRHRRLVPVPALSAHGRYIDSKTCHYASRQLEMSFIECTGLSQAVRNCV